jgi:hypothetical protein
VEKKTDEKKAKKIRRGKWNRKEREKQEKEK